MKTYLTLSILAVGIFINAQNTCSKFALSKGTTLEFEMKNYPLAFEINKDWFSLNDKKKEKEATQINADMTAGKIAPKTVQPMLITVNDMQMEDGKNTLLSRFTMANTDIGIKFQ